MPVAEPHARLASAKSAAAKKTPRPREATPPDDDVPSAGAVDQPLERFFPGCFEILLPAIMTVVPHVVEAIRHDNQSRSAATRQSDEAIDRSLAELLSAVPPLLSQIIPVLIEQIDAAGSERAVAGEEALDDEALERFLPTLLSAIVPTLITALPPALQAVSGTLGGALAGGRAVDGPPPRVVDSEVATRFVGPLLQTFVPAIVANLPQLVSLISGQPSGASRDVGVSWHDFSETNRFPDRDNITVWLEPIDDPNAVEIALQLAPHKTWWKGIQIQDDNHAVIEEIGVQDNNKYASTRVDAQVLLDPGGYLLFMKAKMFGIHTGMYELRTGGLEQLRGHRATFYWYAD